ncbi:MAG: hypothetical protein P8N58_03020 [Emcibacteraceae bacterium]|nr:hypothetical protein [Emcibacteraceae bacterium]
MNNAQKVRSIFEILKNDFAEDASPLELLQCSSWLVEESNSSSRSKPYLTYGKTPLCEQSIYEVMERMPWHAVNREVVWRDDDYAANEPIEHLIDHAIEMAS